MELTLDIGDSLILKVRFSGELEAFPSVGSRKQSQELAEPEESFEEERFELAPRSSSISRSNTGVSADQPIWESKTASQPQPPAESPYSLPKAEPVSQVTGIPAELGTLPKKHQDFYHRKFSEYQEVYPVEKARELAIQAVRKIIGPQ